MRLAILLLTFLLSLPLSAHDWSPVAERVSHSVARITHTGTHQPGLHVCAGFMIHAAKGHVMTAAHCLFDGEKMNPYFQVDGVPSYIIAEFPADDIVIVNGILARPSLDYRRKPVRKGLPVASLGFAYGLETETLLSGVVAAPRANWGEQGEWLTVDRGAIGGMSGGPIFDFDGRVVGITQKTDDWTAISRPLPELVRLTKKYWD